MKPRHIVLTAAILAAYGLAQQPVNPSAKTLSDFEKKVAQYVKARKTWTKGVPALKPGSSPETIEKHGNDVYEKIIAARGGAHQGEFFTPPVQAEFKRLIALTMSGKEGPKIRQSLANDEPVSLKPQVNQKYPPTVPLQTTPPTLLLNLPKLPPDLDYRIVSSNLILRDVDANLILDYVTNAIR